MKIFCSENSFSYATSLKLCRHMLAVFESAEIFVFPAQTGQEWTVQLNAFIIVLGINVSISGRIGAVGRQPHPVISHRGLNAIIGHPVTRFAAGFLHRGNGDDQPDMISFLLPEIII